MRKRHKISLVIIFLAAAVCAGCARKDAELSVRAYVDKKTALIGDRIRLTLEAVYNKDADVGFPEFKDDKIEDFEIKDSTRSIKDSVFGKRRELRSYYISVYTVGRETVPPIEIRYKAKKESAWRSKKTQPVSILVKSLLPKDKAPQDIRDIKSPIYFFEINWAAVLIIFVILFMMAAIFRSYLIRKNRKPVRLPHETAIEELEALKNQLIMTGDVKEHYFGVSDCIRRYIERAFKLKAPEMTTEEFLESLRGSSSLADNHKELLETFMSACDMVKFAKYAPTRIETESVLTTAKRFVEETKKNVYL